MSPSRYKLIHILMITAFAATAVAPMVFSGIPGGNDAAQHYEFAQHVVDAIRQGDNYPSFAADANHGLGDVGLRVYPPAAYYWLALAYFVFGDWYWSSIFVFFVTFLIGGVGVYLWAAESFPNRTALAAAGIFTLMPFHLNEIYNNFLFAQFAAGAVLPFCFLFINRLVKSGRLLDAVGLAAAFAMLMLTNLPLAIIGSLALMVYVIAMFDFKAASRLPVLFCSVGLGLAMSSFYWIRVVTEMGWIKHWSPEYFLKIWSYKENYLLSVRTFTNFGGDDLALWFGDVVLVASLLICVPTLVYFYLRCEIRLALRPLLVILTFAVFMTTPLSGVIWDNLPLLQKVQFPWRWLSIVSLVGSVFAASGIMLAADEMKTVINRSTALGMCAAILPFVIVSSFTMKAAHYMSPPDLERLSNGETFEGWWPVWARREAFSTGEKISVPGREGTVHRWEPLERIFEIESGAPGRATIATYFYPHWMVEIDGQRVDVQPDAFGLVTFEVPARKADVSMRFDEPRLAKAAGWISLLCWISAVFGSVVILSKRVGNHGKYRLH